MLSSSRTDIDAHLRATSEDLDGYMYQMNTILRIQTSASASIKK